MTKPVEAPPSLVGALQSLCDRIKRKHPAVRVAVQASWWKKTKTVSATFFGAHSQDGAEVVLTAAGPAAIDAELYVERSLEADLTGLPFDGQGVPAADGRFKTFFEECERRIEAHVSAGGA